MKPNTWLRVLFAALVVLAVGAVLIAAETMVVKVKNVDGEEVSVDINGEVETIRAEDLADGEQRTFGPQEHEVVVKRVGDHLILLVDGKECGPGCGSKGAAAHGFAFLTADVDQECEGKQRRVVVKHAGDEEGFVWVGDGEEDGHAIVKKILVGEGEPGEVMIQTLGDHLEGDRVRYRCAEDDTEVVIKKDEATQDTYMCPVCGRPMEKVEARTIEVFVQEIEEEIKTDD